MTREEKIAKVISLLRSIEEAVVQDSLVSLNTEQQANPTEAFYQAVRYRIDNAVKLFCCDKYFTE